MLLLAARFSLSAYDAASLELADRLQCPFPLCHGTVMPQSRAAVASRWSAVTKRRDRCTSAVARFSPSNLFFCCQRAGNGYDAVMRDTSGHHDRHAVRHGWHSRPSEPGGGTHRSHRHRPRVAGDMRHLLRRALLPALLVSLAVNLFQNIAIHRLRDRLAAWQAQQVARADAVPAAAAPPRAPDGSPGRPPQTTGEAGLSAPATSVAPTDRVPTALPAFQELPRANLRALTNSLVFFPNGIRVMPGATPDGAIEVHPLAANLIHGYNLLAQGQRADAGAVFESILTACPQWPYGYYYLALATGRRDHMEQAEERLRNLEALGRATPESRIYHALAGLFLGNHEAVKAWLAAHEAGAQPHGKMMLGPLYVPRNIPAAIRRRLETVEELPLLQTIDAAR